MAHHKPAREDYTVGWVCALPVELAAAKEMLDEEYETEQYNGVIYTLGRIGHHKVAMAGLPGGQTGTVSASVVAGRMMEAFKSIRFGLMVGIGGGVPSYEPSMRLGDVVVAKPNNIHGGVVQYDFGKSTPSGFERTGHLNSPPTILLNAVTELQANYMRGRGKLPQYLVKLKRLPNFVREAAGEDVLFDGSYDHAGGGDCRNCSKDHQLNRTAREQEVVIHYGTIASGNQVMRSGVERDRISSELGGVLCFEMEAAGLMNSFPCVVIRGICDYSDSHKNKSWQPYAAGTAAACAKELLSVIPPDEVAEARRAKLVITSYEFLPLLYENGSNYEDSKARNRERVPGTCEWFASHSLFKHWNSSSHHNKAGLLYVTADPGCGKSVLCRYLIDEVLPEANRNVCYFFFKEDFESQRRVLTALCSLLHQIFLSNKSFLSDDILQVYAERGKKFFQSFENLWKIFLLVSQRQETICVLDALDECQDDDRKQLIDAVASACNDDLSGGTKSGFRPKFLISSRPYEYLRAHLFRHVTARIASIHLEGDRGQAADAISEEIQLVLNSRIEETAIIFNLEPDEKTLMMEHLGSVPNRTYLWITLIFDGLLDRKLGLCKADIMSLSRDLPQSLNDAYENILNKSPDLDKARKLLRIVVGATRALSLSEMAVALAIDDANTMATASERIVPRARIREHIRSLCGLFTIVIDDRVYLLHQTAREFLIQKEDAVVPVGAGWQETQVQREATIAYTWKYSISLADANMVLAGICCLYLVSELMMEDDSLLAYAGLHWANHFNQAPKAFQNDMANVALDLCLPSRIINRWARWYNETHSISLPKSPLCLSSTLGIEPVVRLFLTQMGVGLERPSGHSSLVQALKYYEQRDSPSFQGDCRAAFFMAATCGHVPVVQLLLNYGFTVDTRDYKGRTPLSYAAMSGSLPMAKFLLQNNAEVDANDRYGRSPLSFAAHGGHYSIAKLLLDLGGADSHRRDSKQTSPLMYAATRGHDRVVTLLLQKAEEGSFARGESIRGALECACHAGQLTTVKLLLRYHESHPLSFTLGPSALVSAARGQCKAILELLLRTRQCRFNPEGERSPEPLRIAAENGDCDIVQLLLDEGDDTFDMQDENGVRAASLAAMYGHGHVVKLLLQYGASPDFVNVPDDSYDGQTPLCSASRHGFTEVVKILIGLDQVKVNVVDKQGWTPLLHASAQGHDEVVELLLTAPHINVEAADENCRTSLSYAAGMGHDTMVRRLLERGRANVQSLDKCGRPPLFHAAMSGHDAVVTSLVKIGKADVYWQDSYSGGTALLYASKNGHAAVVRVLLQHGAANIDTIDEYARSALSYAAENGQKSIVNLLLKLAKPDVDLCDVFGQTPRSYATQNGHAAIAELLQHYSA